MAIAISLPVSFLPSKAFPGLPAVLLVCLILAIRGAVGVERLELQLGSFSGEGWRAEGVQLRLHWAGASDHFDLSIANMKLKELPFPLLAIQVDCELGKIDDHEVRCDQGQLHAKTPLFDNDRFPVAFRWQQKANRFEISLKDAKLAGGRLSLEGSAATSGWKLRTDASNLALPKLRARLRKLGIASPQMALHGRFNGRFDLSGANDIERVSWNLRFRGLGGNLDEERFIGEGLRGRWRGHFRMAADSYRGQSGLSLEKGAFLTPWFYLEPGAEAVTARVEWSSDGAFRNIRLKQFDYRHPGMLALSGNGVLGMKNGIQLKKLVLDGNNIPLGRLYDSYLRPVQSDPALELLFVGGTAQLRVQMDAHTRLKIELKDAWIRQGDRREGGSEENLHLSGLNGRIHWYSGTDEREESRLSWQGGRLMRHLQIGSGAVGFILNNKSITLARGFSLPLFDGALNAERFSLTQSDAGPKVEFQGYLTPISMRRISAEFGWPPLAGQLSAMIPGVSFENGQLKMRGVALIRAFNGNILVKNLLLDGLFGALPVLEADIELKKLDLETLTSTFSFGKITGRISGSIANLRMEAWQPVSFDASFATPVDDPGSHRISQQAVDNISNLGGVGIAGALSRSFLRFFEEFSYEKLGISCRLRDGVCEMGGIEKSDAGYYLVKGGGLPRIDIVGFNRNTDWYLLIQKLKQITEGGDPIIE